MCQEVDIDPISKTTNKPTQKLRKTQTSLFQNAFFADWGAPAAKPGGVSSTGGRVGGEPAGVEHGGRGGVERPGADGGGAAGGFHQGGRQQSAAAEQHRSIGEQPALIIL